MSAPHLGTATHGSPVGPDDAGRNARIEQLLLSGLDHYFAGRYEQAIDIWTRIVFLERRHGRAHAYIERARSALAERQRESDELVHRGAEAYHQGRVDAAKALLQEAVARGGPSDTAQVLLHQVSRLGPVAPADPDAESTVGRSTHRSSRSTGNVAPMRWVPTLLACAAAVFAVAALAGPLTSMVMEWPTGGTTMPAPMPRQPLPVAEPSEGRIRQARTLHDAGRSREALRLLETVRLGDPLRPEADGLRASIAQAILNTAGVAGVPGAGAPTAVASEAGRTAGTRR